MKNLLNYTFTLLVLFSLFSCKKDKEFNPSDRKNSSTTMEALIVPNNFEYNTTNTVELNFSIINSNQQPLTGAYIQIFTSNPKNEDGNILTTTQPIFKGITDNNGQIQVKLSVQTYVTELYVCPMYIGVANEFIVPISAASTNKLVIRQKHENCIFSATVQKSMVAGFYTLGTWNSVGVPDYLSGQDILTNEFLQKINSALPESKSLPKTHPEYFNGNVNTNIVLKEKGKVYTTFVHEGAGWKNSFGFYTYQLGHAPQTAAEITNLTIIFPNSSFEGSGGGLYSGDKVYIGEFPKNTVIAWFLVAQGWNNGTLTKGAYSVYSNSLLNPETNNALKQHSILLLDQTTKRYVIGFEDVNRQNTSCDNDFNDVVFYASVTPESAVNNDSIVVIGEPIDTDGDGVSDINDDYPTDEKRAFDNNYPWSTLAFEDLWPTKGDYDFNDLVLAYQINQVTNAQNSVVELKTAYSIRAIGAGFHNGFAVQFPVSPSSIDFVQGTKFTSSNYFQISGNGTENGQSTAVVPIFDDAYFAFGNKGMINVYPNVTHINPDTFRTVIHFATPQLISTLGSVPFNPFIVKNRTREIEIHLPNKMPTDLAKISYFGSQDDNSNLSTFRTYLTIDNKPWAINIAGEFYHPYEKVNILEAYLKFADWASSNGVSYPDWYLNLEGYRDLSKIYPQP